MRTTYVSFISIILHHSIEKLTRKYSNSNNGAVSYPTSNDNLLSKKLNTTLLRFDHNADFFKKMFSFLSFTFFIAAKNLTWIKFLKNSQFTIINNREILSEYATNAWFGKTRWWDQMKKPRFRSSYLKSHLGQGNGVISFNLREDGDNQQPQQQRYSDGFSEHAYFLNLTQV